MMSENREFDYEGATELHNRLAEQIVAQILAEPIAAGGNLADVMILCESVLFGVIMGCFSLGSDGKALDVIVTTRARDEARISNLMISVLLLL